ncbi:MAG TPA: 16S rRNA (cytidine(1402)-2'-O)-methyltransferase [Patescibacteria group bacterium]|nr:16S rRNA (cytidine(1402)-2'-O)-methyltransferase [Patescibacteria group bacterium]
MKTLYLVATPIGNLNDFSPRGVEVLNKVDRIYAEDTRRTNVLLNHFGIKKPVASYFEQNELKRIPEILLHLTNHDVALVSDAGTPTISDPGYKLVRSAIQAGYIVISVPGPVAAVLALTSSGLPTDRFSFIGFLPKKDSAKRKVLEEVKSWRTTLIFYESPYRVRESLEAMLEILGDRPVSISRELTKLHEETRRGKLSQMLSGWGPLKGEVTIVVGIKEDDVESLPPDPLA